MRIKQHSTVMMSQTKRAATAVEEPGMYLPRAFSHIYILIMYVPTW